MWKSCFLCTMFSRSVRIRSNWYWYRCCGVSTTQYYELNRKFNKERWSCRIIVMNLAIYIEQAISSFFILFPWEWELISSNDTKCFFSSRFSSLLFVHVPTHRLDKMLWVVVLFLPHSSFALLFSRGSAWNGEMVPQNPVWGYCLHTTNNFHLERSETLLDLCILSLTFWDRSPLFECI